jgi:2-oxoglutarate ferredoxin oxidoreductase subunit alpha
MTKSVGLHDETLSILIGGQAGQGVTRSGSLMGKTLTILGFNVFGIIDYPSLIRGGHNFYVVRASAQKNHSHAAHVDLVIALNKETILLHQDEIAPRGGVICDVNVEFKPEELTREDINIYPIPLTAIVEELEGPSIMRNTVALGGTLGLLGLESDILEEVVAESFVGRNNIAEMNRKAVNRGHSFAIQNFEKLSLEIEVDLEQPERLWVTGNEAVALGAIQAGCKFYAAYPMTPASPVLHYLFNHDRETGMVVIQPESELAAMCMVVGASYSGVRSMTSTSGGGFCLMVEALGLAAMTETPVVVMIGQRPGPSTGMATYTSQGDLFFALNAGQGEFQRVVVAPGDVDQCYYNTIQAFNLAEKFQVPVIILTDKHLLESHESTDIWDLDSIPIERGKLLEMDEWTKEGEYKRYKITPDGISPRLILGTINATMLANSNEHVEEGYTTIDKGEVVAMKNKRMHKVPLIREAISEIKPVRRYGSEEPDITLFVWGSTKGPSLEALKLLKKEGIETRLVQVLYLEPFPVEELAPYLVGGEPKFLIENNSTGQLDKLIKLHNGFTFKNLLLKYDGRQFFPGEIYEKAKEVLN